MRKIEYKVGDYIRDRGTREIVRVCQKKEMSGGRPGYTGFVVDELGEQTRPEDDGIQNGTWGYDTDVAEVVTFGETQVLTRHLRNIIAVRQAGGKNPLDYLTELGAAIDEAASYLRARDEEDSK